MAVEVRSDFDVAMVIRQPDGSMRTVGKHHGKAVHEDEGEMYQAQVVPHLHRTSPDGAWLASFDPDDRRVYVAALGDAGVARGHTIQVEGLELDAGALEQFRWYASDETVDAPTDPGGFVFMTTKGIRFAALSDALLRDGGTVTAQPVFTGLDAGERNLYDTRVVDGGFMVRSSVPDQPAQLHYVRVADGTVQEATPLLPRGVSTGGANVGFDGRIVASVHPEDYGDFEAGRSPLTHEQEFWTYALGSDEPARDHTMACPEEYCWVTNWAPGSSPLVTVIDSTQIGVTELEGKTTVFEFDPDGYSPVHALWSHGTTILAASDDSVRSFDLDGTLRWSWAAPEDQAIMGVHEADDGSALVSVGRELVRVTAGKAKRLARAHGRWAERQYDDDSEMGGMRESFIDQAIPLPGGAVAYTVVDLHETYHPIDWSERFPEDFEDEADEASPNLADPFALAR